ADTGPVPDLRRHGRRTDDAARGRGARLPRSRARAGPHPRCARLPRPVAAGGSAAVGRGPAVRRVPARRPVRARGAGVPAGAGPLLRVDHAAAAGAATRPRRVPAHDEPVGAAHHRAGVDRPRSCHALHRPAAAPVPRLRASAGSGARAAGRHGHRQPRRGLRRPARGARRRPAGAEDMTRPRAGAAVGAGLVALFFVAGAVLPNGLPVGIVLLGVVLGGLQALTAMGIVLVYRATRAINFAQAEIGALAAGVATVLIAGWGLPYFAALPLGLLAAVATGALIDAVVVRRLFTAPRLILTVATIGVAQIIGAFTIVLPTWFTHLRPFSTFTTPFRWHTNIGPLLFTGGHLMAVV